MDIIKHMHDKEFYDEKPSKVDYKQTHISHVFLTDNFVYKIKKPVDFGFLDYSTLEKRKFYCEEEVRLNKRLSPDIYNGVVAITNKGIAKEGEAIEYAVKMKRLPEKNIMKELLKEYKVSYKSIKEMASLLVKFHKEAEKNQEIKSYATAEAMKKNTDENFQQTKDMDIFDKKKYDFIKKSTNDFYNKKEIFQNRIKENKIAECHGDLHSGNIFITDEVKIFDCIEFNKSFRYSDVANDVAFLAMDLEKQKQVPLSKYLINKYVDISEDYTLYTVLDFYKCYRAFVRAKVSAFMLSDAQGKEKEILENDCREYLDIAYNYAKIFSHQKPAVFISCGYSATGKSRWLKIASDIINSPVIRTDVLRKEIFNLKANEKKDDEYRKKYYSEDARQKVYDAMFQESERILSMGGKVSLDASFIKKENRKKIKQLAEKYDADFIIINTTASEETIKKRLVGRQNEKGNVSDADFENAYQFQKKSFQEPSEGEGKVIKIDTEEGEYHNIKKLRKEIKGALGFNEIN